MKSYLAIMALVAFASSGEADHLPVDEDAPPLKPGANRWATPKKARYQTKTRSPGTRQKRRRKQKRRGGRRR